MDGSITAHRDLPVHPVAEGPAPTGTHRGAVVATGHTKLQVQAAWDQRRSDLAELAGVADELADVDRRAAEINERIDRLLAMATAP